MSREIKFRAWHEYEGMTTPYAYLNDSNGFNQAHISKPVVVMQYTGVKDSNGVEVYEGDIVKMNQHLYFTPPAVRTKHLLVTFDEGCFLATRKRPFDRLTLDIRRDIEVVGNIYENPEMMEGGL
jgi:uncharacterized phage protein (TIGR01671 family)